MAGNVQANYGGRATAGLLAENVTAPTSPAGVSDTAATCYNTSSAAPAYAYSIAYSGGSGANCALSFRFQ